MPVAIVGMHRSGTSLLAQMLHRCGLHLGSTDRLLAPRPDNPQGFWEHAGFQELNEAVLTELGGGWDAPPPVPARWDQDPCLARHVADARQLLDEFAGREPWGWKDPRTSLTVSLWLELIPDLKVVLCLRNPLEVACSLGRRNGFSYSKAIRLWQVYNDRVLETPAIERIAVSYDRVLSSPETELARVLDFLGIATAPPVLRDAAELCRDDLRHIRFGTGDLQAVRCHPDIVDLYGRLRTEAGTGSHEGVRPAGSSGSNRILDEATLEAMVAAQSVAEVPEDGAVDGLRCSPREHLAESLRVVPDGDSDEKTGGELVDPYVANVREFVAQTTPRGAFVLLLTSGDDRLLQVPARAVWPFPCDEQGTFGATGKPADGRDAIALLERLRERGATHIVFLDPELWWLEHYEGLQEHLGRDGGPVAQSPLGVAYALVSPAR